MVDVTEARRNVQEEEVSYRAAVSEGTWFKIGASLNFINKRQFDTHNFMLNGPYNSGLLGTGLDGMYVFQFDCEIVGISAFNLVAGTSGTTTFDCHWLNGSGSDQGSIFSVKPSIDYTAGNNAYLSTNIIDATSSGGTGLTIPTLSKTQFDQYDALRMDLDASQVRAENCGLLIHFRPR